MVGAKESVEDCCFCCYWSLSREHSIKLCTAKRPIPHDNNSPVTQPPGNGMAFLEQTEYEDGFFI
jgi:hypothetical protein